MKVSNKMAILANESENRTGLPLLHGAFGSTKQSFLWRKNAHELHHLALFQVGDAASARVHAGMDMCGKILVGEWMITCAKMVVEGWMNIECGYFPPLCVRCSVGVLMNRTQRAEAARRSCSGQTDMSFGFWNGQTDMSFGFWNGNQLYVLDVQQSLFLSIN